MYPCPVAWKLLFNLIMFFSSTQPDNRKLNKHWKISVVFPLYTNNMTIYNKWSCIFLCRLWRSRICAIAIIIIICIELLSFSDRGDCLFYGQFTFLLNQIKINKFGDEINTILFFHINITIIDCKCSLCRLPTSYFYIFK